MQKITLLLVLLALALLHPVSAKDLKTKFMKETQSNLDSDLIGFMDSLLSESALFTLVNDASSSERDVAANKFANAERHSESNFGASAQ